MPQEGLRYNAKAINWEDATSSALGVFASVKEEQIRGPAKSLKNSSGRKKQLFREPLTRIRHLPVSVQESQLLSSSRNMYWHGTKLRETNTLF